MNGVKSYASSYLYNKVPDYERSILEFVMKAQRINKISESFNGIVEDVKRRQTTAVISRVLMRDDVVLCIYDGKPLPPSFKVFACKDVKEDKNVKIFIDCTGLISLKNGYLVCSKIDILNTYLLSAMTNIVYYNQTDRIVNNAGVIQFGTDCFVSLASHIFDYLRVNGYSENKNKIAYILAMYFQVNLLGLERTDTSVRNMAAKISGIQTRESSAMEIYYNDEDIININNLINSIATTFKMKGMTTDVFIEKWNWFYGTGTHFATELFVAFSSLITNAYCGSYVNNQKSIEKCCGRSMVNYTNSLIRICSDTIDNGFRYESSIDRSIYDRDQSIISEALFDKVPRNMLLTEDDMIKGGANLEKKLKVLLNAYPEKKRSHWAYKNFSGIVATTDYFFTGRAKGYKDSISVAAKVCIKFLNIKDKNKAIDMSHRIVINLTKQMANKDNKIFDTPDTKRIRDDAEKALKILDPSYKITENVIEDKPENTKDHVEIPVVNGSVMQGFIESKKK